MKIAFVNKEKLSSGKPNSNPAGGNKATAQERVRKYRHLISNDKIKTSCKTN